MRTIFHADMNAYFASVEELFNPRLRDVPMAICGDPESRRGIILAKNEHAKRFGIKTAETIYQAKQKCPGLVLRRARHGLYSEYCAKANRIYEEYTDLLEKASIDESYLDVTGTLHLFGMGGEALANEIRKRIHRELGLTISVGVADNKFFAKMASDMKKPNAVTVLNGGNYKEKLWPLPIEDMLMVGKKTASTLLEMNIRTIGDLAQMDPAVLLYKLGKLGRHLHANANGKDTSPVLPLEAERGVQSIGNGITFKRDLISAWDFQTAITALSDTVASRLRKEGLKCRAVQLTIKDPNFRVITRQRALPAPTWLASELSVACRALLATAWPDGKPIRLLTVTALKLVPREAATEQLTFFDSPDAIAGRKRKEQLEMTMDHLRCRFGENIIGAASVACNDLGIHEYHEPANDDL